MDHLPYPGDAGLPPIEIPYVCEEILPLFSGLDFSSMLATLPKCEIWYHGESSIAASKAQASIYFGLVREAAGPSFRIKDFVRKSDLSGQRVVTLKKLNDVWGWQSSRHRDEALKNLMDRLSPSLPRVFEHVAYIRGLDELGNLIGLSIKILIWSLAGTLPSGGWPRFGDDDILHQRMLDSGWCPYWTNIYGKRFSSPLIYCLTGLPRSRHGGHESCSQYESCKVYDVNPVTYVTEHTPRCEKQQCHFSGPDVRDLGLIVERGKIPLIRFSEKRRPLASHLLKRVRQGSATANDSDFKTAENNVIKIDLVEHTFGRPFIAISHVWAGGLGHFDKNTLPRCQLDLLYERARQCKQKLYGEGILASFLDFLDEADAKVSWEDKVIRAYHRFIIRATAEDTSTLYLWIDTLCIPADKEIPNLETRKKQAIDKMAHVYAMAMHVMVIDHTVQKLSFKDESEISLAGQLLTCPWMTRCWTFQEACLAREFSYLLQDGLINPRRWLSPAPEADTSSQPRTIFEETLMKECLNIFKEIPDVLNESVSDSGREDPAYPLFQVWDQLATRTTTVPEDSHGILAVMLGLSVEELFTENSAAPKEADSSPPVRSPSQRMLAILRAQTSLPLSMLYLPYPKGTRLCEDNEWVPKFASGSLDASFGRMDRVDDGLGWRFALSDTNSCAVILEADIKNLTDTAFYVHLGASLLGEGLRLESKVLQIRLKWTDAHNLEQKFGENSLFFILHGFNGNPSYRGACFSISKTTEMERVRLKFICPLEYRLELSKAANTKNGHDPAVLNYQVHWASNALVKATCILDCDPSIWPKLVYRRPKAKVLQKSLIFPIGAFVLLFWSVYTAVIVADPRWRLYSPILTGSLYVSRVIQKIPLVGWFVSPQSWWLRNVRYTLPLSVLVARGFAFAIFDYPRLEAVAERVRYERYANSFDYVPVHELSVKETTRLDVERSYQFPRRWLLGIPLTYTMLAFVSQRWVWGPGKAGAWYGSFNSEVSKLFALGVLWEIPGRIVVEFVWRYFMLDIESQGASHGYSINALLLAYNGSRLGLRRVLGLLVA